MNILLSSVDVKQCLCDLNLHCGSLVTHKSNMALHFRKAGNLNGINAEVCPDVAGSSSSGSGDLFELSDRSNTTYFYYFPHY